MSVRGDQDGGLPYTLPALEQLPADEARDLFELMRGASTFEAAALDKSIDSMVSALPRPLRKVTKKIMFGGR
ncbi:hypothetical protein ACFWUP_11770 [Nocardia sp. NPDC058658]|uniref:hypothetical protein n=1 Tax=Nocardia sp. NPDC058658 TaxID=3346580 RepID=UPI00364C85DE